MTNKILFLIFLSSFSLVGSLGKKRDKKDELAEFMKSKNLRRVYGSKMMKMAHKMEDMLEHPMEPHDVQFILFTKKAPTTQKVIHKKMSRKQILNFGFDPNANTKIICHGFMSDYSSGPGEILKPAFLNLTNAPNVILIDWSKFASIYQTPARTGKSLSSSQPSFWQKVKGYFKVLSKEGWGGWLNFFPPAENTQIVGDETAQLIAHLVQNVGARLSGFHLIGHSLGSHAMGAAGRGLHRYLPGKKIPRITGLDPAGPCFFDSLGDDSVCVLASQKFRSRLFSNKSSSGVREGRGRFRRPVALSASDADFVDGIHTNGALLGTLKSVGHADFYPNGGYRQPGCPYFSIFKDPCSHSIASAYYKATIMPLRPDEDFAVATKCDSFENLEKCKEKEHPKVALLGENCDSTAKGNFYLETKKRAEPPFFF